MVQPISTTTDIQEIHGVKPTRPKKVVKEGDTLEISWEAGRALQRQRDIQLAWKAINETPDIREDKVRLARERLDSGFYNQADIIDAISKRMIL